MGSVTITNVLDTHIGQDQPNTNYNQGGSLYIRQWSGDIRVAYLYFSRPFPLGVNVTSAKLYLYGYAKPVSGAIELYVRRLNQTISLPKITWNTRATAFVYPEATATKSGTYPDRTEWEIDITAQMSALAAGAKWYGLQIGSDWATETWSPRFMAANHPNPDLRPRVEIEWSDAPSTPTQLSPAGGRVISTAQPIVRGDYKDVSGSTQLGKIQVQVHTTSSFTSPAYDSGEQDADGPEWDLTGSAFTATAGTTYYWRMRVADEANLWSGWSSPATFVYRALPTLTVDTPGEAPNDFVEEPTPPVFWTASSQAAYQLGFYRRVGDKDVLLWSRVKTLGVTDGFVVPAGLITVKDATYRVDVRIYDAYDREAVPNGPAWTQVTRYFTYEFSADTSPVTGLTAVGADPYPGVALEWDRATAPDSYSVIRDGVVIAAGLDPDDDTFISGIHYGWDDRFPIKGRTHTYSVQAIVNGKAALASPGSTAVVVNRFLGTWLVDPEPDGPMVMLVNDKDRIIEYGEQSEPFTPLGSSKTIVITQGQQGYQGEITGELRSDVSITEDVEELRDNLLDIRKRPSQVFYLLMTRTSIPVALHRIQCSPMVNAEPAYAVKFNYFEQ